MERDKMDRLIKEKLEAYQPDFTEAAWKEFVPNLSKTYWWKTWWGILSITGILVLGIFLLFPGKTADIKDISLAQAEIQNPSPQSNLERTNNTALSFIENDKIEADPVTIPSIDLSSEMKEDDKTKASTAIFPAIKKRTPHQPIYKRINKHAAEMNQKGLKVKVDNDGQNIFNYSDPGLMRHLFEVEEKEGTNASTAVKGIGDLYKIKEPLHWDVTLGPFVSWLYPVDGFSATRLPYSEELFSWRFPGLNIALLVNQKWSVSAGVMGGNTENYVAVGEGYPIQNLLHFPDWSEATYTVDNIRIETRQLLLPLSLQYREKIKGNFGMNFKVGLVAHHIGDQNFFYNKPIFASSLGYSTSVSQNTWQVSYLTGGLGISYDLSRRFSTSLEGEYWKGLKPIGAEQHKYHLMGISFGVNYRLFPKE